MTDLDDFTLYASWGNDGSADLTLTHTPCGWYADDDALPGTAAPAIHGHPWEGKAQLSALVAAARKHLETSHP